MLLNHHIKDDYIMRNFSTRHAISRAEFFLVLAEDCKPHQRMNFEAFLEASIIFARTAIHRLQHEFSRHPEWKDWFDALKDDPAVSFFRVQRDLILKEGRPKLGQIIDFNPIIFAKELYYFVDPTIDASITVRNHLESLSETVHLAESMFLSVSKMGKQRHPKSKDCL